MLPDAVRRQQAWAAEVYLLSPGSGSPDNNAVANDTIYSFARMPQFLAQTPTIEYQLYKADKRRHGDGAARVERIAAEHAQREGNQTQWLSRGNLYKPGQLSGKVVCDEGGSGQ